MEVTTGGVIASLPPNLGRASGRRYTSFTTCVYSVSLSVNAVCNTCSMYLLVQEKKELALNYCTKLTCSLSLLFGGRRYILCQHVNTLFITFHLHSIFQFSYFLPTHLISVLNCECFHPSKPIVHSSII